MPEVYADAPRAIVLHRLPRQPHGSQTSESVEAYQLCKLVVGLEPAQHAAELVVVAVLSQACLLLQYVSGACY